MENLTNDQTLFLIKESCKKQEFIMVVCGAFDSKFGTHTRVFDSSLKR